MKLVKKTKKEVYAEHGILFNSDGKIYSPLLDRWIEPLLINGNDKIGKGVWHYSITAGNKAVTDEVIKKAIENSPLLNDKDIETLKRLAGGTCSCNCPGCYAQTGFYSFDSTLASLARKTLIVRLDMEWTERAIMAQIEADKIEYLRIHASGDFFSDDYVRMWVRIGKAFPDVIMWTYTKTLFKSLPEFDALKNCNIVKSYIDGKHINYGHAGYIVALYRELKERGEDVWLCRCGIDSNQHCAGCHHCYTAKYVLFLEHSTDYKAASDPDITEYIKCVLEQDAEEKARHAA